MLMNKYILLAFDEAKNAMQMWDYPVWSVMFNDEWEIIIWRNERNTNNDKKSHAEINLIKTAKKYNITNKIIYVTLEPCDMCTQALMDFWINEINYILEDPIKWWLNNIKNKNIKIIQHNDGWIYLDLLMKVFEPQKIKFKAYYDYYINKYLKW